MKGAERKVSPGRVPWHRSGKETREEEVSGKLTKKTLWSWSVLAEEVWGGRCYRAMGGKRCKEVFEGEGGKGESESERKEGEEE